jgi:hypothetical protein
MVGIILARREQERSKQGFELTSISQGLALESIMKSNPKISKQLFFLFGSSLK